MTLRFWGARGSLPTPGPNTIRYGGNTLCIELRCGPHLLILDAGSGLRAFGLDLAGKGPVDADILLSHTHLDHICGFPFFGPMYDPRAALRIWAGHLPPPDGIRQALLRGWQAPLMPDLDRAFRAGIEFHDFIPGSTLPVRADVTVTTIPLHHPGGAVGYRITYDGASVCYITDTEHPAAGIDQALRDFIQQTDVLIYDSSYTTEEYQSRVGWGHSTWEAAIDLADAAAVGRLVLFHHEPNHDDSMMDTIVQKVQARRPGSLAAMEGMTLTVGAD